MRKSDLKTFVEKLIDAKHSPIQSKINTVSEETLSVLIEEFLKQPHIKQIRDIAENLAEIAEQHIDELPIKTYDISRLRTDFINMRYDVEQTLQGQLYRALTGEGDKVFFVFGKDFTQDITNLANEIKPLKNRLEELTKLRNELLNIITLSRTAKDAYKNLAAAGLDMSQFEEPSQYLPVVVKLTIDPNILKGD